MNMFKPEYQICCGNNLVDEEYLRYTFNSKHQYDVLVLRDFGFAPNVIANTSSEITDTNADRKTIGIQEHSAQMIFSPDRIKIKIVNPNLSFNSNSNSDYNPLTEPTNHNTYHYLPDSNEGLLLIMTEPEL